MIQHHIARPVNIWIKVDVGTHRTGIEYHNLDEISELASLISQSPKTVLQGLLVHAGHSYHTFSRLQTLSVFQDSISHVNNIRDHLNRLGFSGLKISFGDTPTLSLSPLPPLHGIDEIRPGNFIFYDAMQMQIGSCLETNVAVAVMCPVIAKHPSRKEVVIHGGAIHLSKEFICEPAETGSRFYGYIALPQSSDTRNLSWGPIIQGARVKSLSQEHGVISFDNHQDFEGITIGGSVFIIPVHSCLVVTHLRKYITTDGESIPAMEEHLAEF
ncbi:alanine racemase [Pelomyxa schiedti]|nr:alanine racemase [Pelomyxa schiedti]